MLARGMALELANQGITVNLVAPGTILTDLNRENFADEEFKRKKLSLIPMERLGIPDDVAGAVLYLASDEASYITGITITVDGGLTLVLMLKFTPFVMAAPSERVARALLVAIHTMDRCPWHITYG